MKKYHKYSMLGLKALQRAAVKVAEDAKKNNYKIPVWQNGKIEFVVPEIITNHTGSPDNKVERI
ncbi:MAG: hypothetical protein PF482_03375 [Desulfobacteraceae bacterium]|jgi:hypothetical protein|nr:hypothetical protein [Desulfobacteraceae bacterium]